MQTHLSDAWYRATDLTVVSGEGCMVRTEDGTDYLDLTSGIGVTSTGHGHPRIVEAVREQAGRFLHAQVNCYRHPLLEPFAARLAEVAPPGIDRFFVTSSGSEAVEGAVKLVRRATGRRNLVVMEGSFHGRTHLAMAMTTSRSSYRSGYQPLPAAIFVTPFPRAFEWRVDEPTAVDRAIRGLRVLLARQTDPAETAAVVMEPVLGEGGYLPAPAAYVRGVREICDEHGILLVADEVQSGFGRTGAMFAVEHSEVVPDAVVMGKGIASGFPVAAIGATAELMARWPAGAHGGTYGGNPMGCAAGLATLDVIRDEGLVANAAERGAQLLAGLAGLQGSHAALGDARGLGLMVGAEIVDTAGTPDGARAAAIVRHCLTEARVILMTCGTWGNVVRFMAPLVVSADEVDRGLAAFAAALDATA
jgi:4-aminobutyrate aminotransferase